MASPPIAVSPCRVRRRVQPRTAWSEPVMHEFLTEHRDELLARCKTKVAQRPQRAATEEQLHNCVPLFLAQLPRTLLAERSGLPGLGIAISGPSGGDARVLSGIGLAAAAHSRASRGPVAPRTVFSLDALLEEARAVAALAAGAKGCTLAYASVDPLLQTEADRPALLGALNHLLADAVGFTLPHSRVALSARPTGSGIVIDVDVADHCGGLPTDFAETRSQPFRQLGGDRSGPGLGLSIARQNVQAIGGRLTVDDVPGAGCVFSIHLPNPGASPGADPVPPRISPTPRTSMCRARPARRKPVP